MSFRKDLLYKADSISKGSFVKYVTRKGERGSSVALRSYLKTWVKCGKRLTYFTNDPLAFSIQ